MRQVATLIVLGVMLAVPQAAAKEPLAPMTVFGVVWQNRQTSLVELDALTLKPVSKAVALGKAGSYLGRSPGGGYRAGTTVLDQNTSRFRLEWPAVAIDPRGRRAAVVPGDGPVALVDLASLAVTSHAMRMPAAARKEIEGSERTAIWTWNDTIAVGGRTWTASGQPKNSMPAGITLIDTMDWSSRTLDHETTGVSYTGLGGIVLGWGSVWDATTQKSVGFGLTGYGSDGTRLFHLFGTDAVAVATIAGTYAYIANNSMTHYEIVDTIAGKVIGSVDTAQTTTLAATRPNY